MQYAFTYLSTDQLAAIARKLTNVVRITSGRLMPSTPMEYEMSNEGIQSSTNVFCIVPTPCLEKRLGIRPQPGTERNDERDRRRRQGKVTQQFHVGLGQARNHQGANRRQKNNQTEPESVCVHSV